MLGMKESEKTDEQYGIWYTPGKGWDMAKPGWVTDTKRSDMVCFSSEKEARRDLKSWAVHPDLYEVRKLNPKGARRR
jgi:hypothetical protein